jgi:hypothetical protein
VAGHRKFRELVAHLDQDPVARLKTDAYRRAIEDALKLGELRERRGATQQTVANGLGSSQANVSRIQHEDDT